MVDYTPESQEELNTDSTLGLLRVLSVFSNPDQQMGTNEDSNSYFAVNNFVPLTPEELNIIFRRSYLARKIVEKYPSEAKVLGYNLINEKGEIINKDDVLLLNAFYKGIVNGRLYGHCYLIMLYENTDPFQPVKPGDKITGFITEFGLRREGDYFKKSDDELFHYTKVNVFYGRETYIPYLKPDDERYAESVLEGVIITLKNYVSSNETVRKILSNLSYLTVGIKNLGNMTKTEKGREDVYLRLTSIRTNRNTNRILAYDKENEILSYISQTISGINELMSNIKEIFIAESDYPPEQLFESSTNQSIGSGIANQLIARFLWAKRCHSWTVDNLQMQYQIHFDRHYPKQNLKVEIPFKLNLSQVEQAELEKMASERNKNLIESKIIAPREARSGYANDEFSLNITLNDEYYLMLEKISQNQINTNPDNTNNDPENLNRDSGVFIPDDQTWDALANLTEEDLKAVMEGALNA